MEFEYLSLKPLSLRILQYLFEHSSVKADEVAAELGISAAQVNAAVTKSLVRFGLVLRRGCLTRLMKKEYNVLEITDKGRRFIEWQLSISGLK